MEESKAGLDENSREYNRLCLEQALSSTTYDIQSVREMIDAPVFFEHIDLDQMSKDLAQQSQELVDLQKKFHENDLPPIKEEESDNSSRGSLVDDYADLSSEPMDFF